MAARVMQWLFLFLFSQVLALNPSPSPQPASQPRYPDGPITGVPWVVPDLSRGVLPYTAVYRTDRLKEAKRAEAGDPNAIRKTYEWHIPVSTVAGTQAVSRDLIKAWQRLEERTYHHVMTRLNYLIGKTEFECLAKGFAWQVYGSWFELNPPLPEPRVSALDGYFPQQPKPFQPPLPLRPAASEGQHRLDWYTYYYSSSFRVPPDDYCGDMGPGAGDFPLYPYVPGFKITIGGATIFSTPGYPGPLVIDTGEFEGRIRRGLELAARKYIPDYEADVLKALKPRGDVSDLLKAVGDFFQQASKGKLQDPVVFLPTSWTGHTPGLGAVVTPVVRLVDYPSALKDLQEILQGITQAKYSDKLLDAAKYAYFYDNFRGLVNRLGLSFSLPPLIDTARQALNTLAGLGDHRDPVARGIWPLEELKRFFPPSIPQVHEALGYTTYYQVFGKIEAYPLPDPQASWRPGEYAMVAFARSPHIWNIPVVCFVETSSCMPDVPNISPIFFAPYTLILAGPRYYYDWVSVPDGYPIPRVEGLPVPVIPLPKR